MYIGFMTRRRVFESVEEQDGGNSLPVKNLTLFSRRKGGYLLQLLRPGRWTFCLMVLALMTLMIAKFALLNTLQNLNIDREKLMFTTRRSSANVESFDRANRVVVEAAAADFKQIPSPEKFSVRFLIIN